MARGVRAGQATLRDQLVGVIEPVTRAAGFDLEGVSVSRIGRRHRVQVVVDHDQGVGLDAIAEISRAVSAALDTAETAGEAAMPGEYVLEVSSPGVDRPLTEPRHWRRSVGRLVTVPVTGSTPDSGGRTAGSQTAGSAVAGRVVAATEVGVTLEVDGATRQLAYEQLGPGRMQVELGRLADEGEA